jgi:hypothetical protein
MASLDAGAGMLVTAICRPTLPPSGYNGQPCADVVRSDGYLLICLPDLAGTREKGILDDRSH